MRIVTVTYAIGDHHEFDDSRFKELDQELMDVQSRSQVGLVYLTRSVVIAHDPMSDDNFFDD